MLKNHFLLLSLGVSMSLYAGSISSTPIESSLVVYNGNIGLVHEEKKITLDEGTQAIIYEDVAQTVQTDSVNVIFPSPVTLYSQQYRFDSITAAKLLEAHIGKVIKVKTAVKRDEFIIQEATLLAADKYNAVVKTTKGEIFSTVSSMIIFKNVPDTLITKPSLVWNINSSKSMESTISVDYLINNITWQSNYVLNLKENRADLSGWITVDNRSGKRFNDVKLNVLAGDINRAKRTPQRVMYKAAAMVMEDAPVSHIAHEGYHFYTIPFRITLANNEKTQIKFIDERHLPIKRRYEARLNHPNYLHSEIKHKVSQFVEIDSLEVPLPSGVVRSYSKVNDTTLLLGESRVDHTPKHEKISLRLGTNFDLKVNEKLIERNDDKRYFDERISYEVINRSNIEQTVELLIPFIKSAYHAKASIDTKQTYRWKDGSTMQFKIKVKADSKESFDVHYRSKK
ncbi:MAG: hypothetical protein DRG24_06330 [Epsilonproteobacteria bacterium]|nr:MAG: hypothetical protein DRG24_06330 [Campylobacterota bacterium]